MANQTLVIGTIYNIDEHTRFEFTPPNAGFYEFHTYSDEVYVGDSESSIGEAGYYEKLITSQLLGDKLYYIDVDPYDSGKPIPSCKFEATLQTAINGKSPYLDTNTGTWFEWNDVTQQYEDTAINAIGPKGDQGDKGDPTTEFWDNNNNIARKYWCGTQTEFDAILDMSQYSGFIMDIIEG